MRKIAIVAMCFLLLCTSALALEWQSIRKDIGLSSIVNAPQLGIDEVYKGNLNMYYRLSGTLQTQGTVILVTNLGRDTYSWDSAMLTANSDSMVRFVATARYIDNGAVTSKALTVSVYKQTGRVTITGAGVNLNLV